MRTDVEPRSQRLERSCYVDVAAVLYLGRRDAVEVCTVLCKFLRNLIFETPRDHHDLIQRRCRLSLRGDGAGRGECPAGEIPYPVQIPLPFQKTSSLAVQTGLEPLGYQVPVELPPDEDQLR